MTVAVNETWKRIIKAANRNAERAQKAFPGLTRDEALEAAAAEQSLYQFVLQAWPHVEASEFVDGEHIRQVCLHLQAFSDGWIPNLGCNIPPRYMKSTLFSVMFPAWEWARRIPPEKSHLIRCVGSKERYLTLSYKEELAINDNWRARTLMRSPWYQQRWGWRWKFSGDQNVKSRYTNDQGGARVATSITSAIGQGGTRIMIDDPQSYVDALNRDASDKVVNTYQGNLSMRSFGERTRKACIMQRLSFHDLTAYLQKLTKAGLEEWVFLVLPIVFTPNNVWHTYLGTDAEGNPRVYNDPGEGRVRFGGDWRTEPGEPLWPELYGGVERAKEQLEKIRMKTDETVWAAQGLQDPMPPGGGPYRSEEWFPTYDRLPTYEEMGGYFLYSTWDCAVKDKEHNDPTAGYLVAYFPRTGMHFVLDRFWFREQFIGQEWVLQHCARKAISHGCCHVIEGGGNGSALVSALNRWMDEEIERRDMDRGEDDPMNRFYEWMPRGLSKLGRATIASPRFRAKKIYWPAWAKQRGGWYDEVVRQFLQFPYAEHDDDVDAINQGIIWVETEGLALFLQAGSEYHVGRPEAEDYYEDFPDWNPGSENPGAGNWARRMSGLWTPWGKGDK